MDTSKLEEKLGQLRGLDFENAEAQERAAGNVFPELLFTKSFQVRLAAMALGKKTADIKELPMKEYVEITRRTFTFLNALSETETA